MSDYTICPSLLEYSDLNLELDTYIEVLSRFILKNSIHEIVIDDGDHIINTYKKVFAAQSFYMQREWLDKIYKKGNFSTIHISNKVNTQELLFLKACMLSIDKLLITNDKTTYKKPNTKPHLKKINNLFNNSEGALDMKLYDSKEMTDLRRAVNKYEEDIKTSQRKKISKVNPTIYSVDKYAVSSPPELLILVFTQIEFDTIIEIAGLSSTYTKMMISLFGNQFYDLGIPNLNVWLAKIGSGTSNVTGSIISLTEILNNIKAKYNLLPKAVIGVGIAFGLVPSKQSIGDIIISKQVAPYQTIKLSNGNIIDRNDKISIDKNLISFFTNLKINYFKFKKDNDSLPEIFDGLLVSGDFLVNDPYFVQYLLQQYPEALGGEMEASGIYAVCQNYGIKWIIIKSICDWGHKKTSKFQKQAAINSIDFLLHCLYSSSANSFFKSI